MTTDTITTLRQLCDYFGAETPDQLNRRLYKDTGCGASISIRVPLKVTPEDIAFGRTEGTGLHTVEWCWLHNGDERWAGLTGDERLHSFTIQTIVEGTEETLDSGPFVLPVPSIDVAAWVERMEQDALQIWDEGNGGV